MADSKSDEMVVSIRMKKKLVDLIDKERELYNLPRTSWITQTVVEKLEKLGHELR